MQLQYQSLINQCQIRYRNTVFFGSIQMVILVYYVLHAVNQGWFSITTRQEPFIKILDFVNKIYKTSSRDSAKHIQDLYEYIPERYRVY